MDANKAGERGVGGSYKIYRSILKKLYDLVDRLMERSGIGAAPGKFDFPGMLGSKSCSCKTTAYFGSRTNFGTESCIESSFNFT